MRKLLKYYVHFFLLFLPHFLASQARVDYSQKNWIDSKKEYRFEHVTKGIRSNFENLKSIYQDTTGLVWLGLMGKGLYHYDGKNIDRFYLKNSTLFSSREQVFIEHKGFLYLNTGLELLVFDPIKKKVVETIEADLPKDWVIESLAFFEDDIYATCIHLEEGDSITSFQVWKSSRKENLQPLNKEVYETEGQTVIAAQSNIIFIKEKAVFFKLNTKGEKLEAIHLPEGGTKFIFQRSNLIDSDGRFWISVQDSIYSKYKKEHRPFGLFYLQENEFISAGENHITTNILEIGNDLLLGGRGFRHGALIYNFNRDEKIFYGMRKSLRKSKDWHQGNIDAGIFELHKTSSGIIWIGGQYGLIKMIPYKKLFTSFDTDYQIRGITEDKEGNVYFASRLIKMIPANTNQVIDTRSGGLIIWSLDYFKNKLYMETRVLNLPAPFQRGDSHEIYPGGQQAPYENYVLLVDRKGILWNIKRTTSTLYLIETRTEKVIKEIDLSNYLNEQLKPNYLYQSPVDHTLWLGTDGKGILVFDEDGNLIHHLSEIYEDRPFLNSLLIQAFYQDSEGQMWIGHDQGISRLNPKTFEIQHFEIVPGSTFQNLVYGILPEGDQFLWVSTNKGIYRFDKESNISTGFPLNPEVANKEFNRTSFYKANNGRMFFGSYKGLYAFYPEEVMDFYEGDQVKNLPITINSFSKFDGNQEKLITQNFNADIEEINLKHNDRFFSLAYSVADYRSPNNNLYSHYLEGYDIEWSKPNYDNKLRYDNLSPGTYNLKLRGGLTPTSLSSNERNLKIIVAQAWYKTWWAIGAYLLFLGSLLYGFYQYNLKRKLDQREAQRLKELDALKTRLYTNITHEFRTPLTVILGMNDQIKEYPREKEMIKRNGKNLLRLVNQMLDLAKLESGQMKLNLIQGDLVAYLQYLSESFQSFADSKDIRLTFFAETEHLLMDFDEAKIQYILNNLISNAIKYTPAGGKVIIHVKEKLRNNQQYLYINVKDSGIGISEEDLDFIFDRFYQVDDTSTRKEEGTGIGLALTKELTELLGGFIEVNSIKGKGSEFKVYLPVNNQAELISQEVIEQNLSDSIEKELIPTGILAAEQIDDPFVGAPLPLLLLVEDNPDVVTYIRLCLQKEYQIKVANNGQEGIDKAIEMVPDIIITDVMMPLKDGYEVCDTLKNDERTSHIPIIILTAKASHDDKIAGLTRGADAYLSKPFNKEELLIRLKKLVENRRKLQQHFSQDISLNSSTNNYPQENEFLKKLTKVVIENLSNPDLDVVRLCRAVHLSHTQVYRKVKALTGKSPSIFIRSIRLKHALKLLQTTNLNVSEIAYEVGFAEPNYFSRTFSEEFGKPPSAIRK